MKLRPPKWADAFLRWCLDPDMLEDIQGDLYELYHFRCAQRGKLCANLKFFWEVLQFMRVPLLKNPFTKATKIYLVVERDQSGPDCFVKVVPLQRWDDIVFESRNKDYGAYSIRNSYRNSMLIGFSIVLLLSLTIVLWWWVQFRL